MSPQGPALDCLLSETAQTLKCGTRDANLVKVEDSSLPSLSVLRGWPGSSSCQDTELLGSFPSATLSVRFSASDTTVAGALAVEYLIEDPAFP